MALNLISWDLRLPFEGSLAGVSAYVFLESSRTGELSTAAISGTDEGLRGLLAHTI